VFAAFAPMNWSSVVGDRQFTEAAIDGKVAATITAPTNRALLTICDFIHYLRISRIKVHALQIEICVTEHIVSVGSDAALANPTNFLSSSGTAYALGEARAKKARKVLATAC
jgi:hypothetical protein